MQFITTSSITVSATPVEPDPDWQTGAASAWWLHHSLASLDDELRQRGSGLVIRSGAAPEVLEQLVSETGADGVFFSRRYEPASRAEETALEEAVQPGIDIHAFDDSLLNHPRVVKTQGGTPFRVFTPFWKAASSLGEPPTPGAGSGRRRRASTPRWSPRTWPSSWSSAHARQACR